MRKRSAAHGCRVSSLGLQLNRAPPGAFGKRYGGGTKADAFIPPSFSIMNIVKRVNRGYTFFINGGIYGKTQSGKSE
jgi:hypothetical protein